MGDRDERELKYEKQGHVLKTVDGIIDWFAYESGNHNGPECIKCGYNACWHCNPNPPKCTE